MRGHRTPLMSRAKADMTSIRMKTLLSRVVKTLLSWVVKTLSSWVVKTLLSHRRRS